MNGNSVEKYALLTDEAKREIRTRHLFDLETAHYRLFLEETEEPGANDDRTRALAEIDRRMTEHRRALGLDDVTEDAREDDGEG